MLSSHIHKHLQTDLLYVRGCTGWFHRPRKSALSSYFVVCVVGTALLYENLVLRIRSSLKRSRLELYYEPTSCCRVTSSARCWCISHPSWRRQILCRALLAGCWEIQGHFLYSCSNHPPGLLLPDSSQTPIQRPPLERTILLRVVPKMQPNFLQMD